MAIVKQTQKTVQVHPDVLPVSNPTTGASLLQGWGVVSVTSTSTGTHLTLPAPPAAGVVQTVVYAAGGATASTAEVFIHTNSTATPFVGSTNNTVSLDADGEVATFIAVSASEWAVTVSGTTDGLTLTASTGAPE